MWGDPCNAASPDDPSEMLQQNKSVRNSVSHSFTLTEAAPVNHS